MEVGKEELQAAVTADLQGQASGCAAAVPEADGVRPNGAPILDGGAGGSGSSDRMADMMARLRLTAAEAKAVVLDDEEETDLVDPAKALVGKVLAPSVLHIQTISAAMRPAWGNPKGFVFNPVGDNLFLAEFGCGANRDRVFDREPWVVGKHAVLLKKYNSDFKPLQVRFDRMAIWARIIDLPYRLMNERRGKEIAKPLGTVLKVDADEQGRCWGGFMRVRVEINVEEPIPRYVTVFSSRDKSFEWYEVKYERLPLFCFSCGMLGHSFLVCSTPAERDEDGDLPYAAKRLCVFDDQNKKSSSAKSGNASNSAGGGTSGFDSRGSSGGAAQPGTSKSRGKKPASQDSERGTEVTSPMRSQGRGKGPGRGVSRASRGRGRGRANGPGRELFPEQEGTLVVAGQKRKSGKSADPKDSPASQNNMMDCLALVTSSKEDAQSAMILEVEEVGDIDSCKKQRVIRSRSADQAEAVEQPRHTQ